MHFKSAINHNTAPLIILSKKKSDIPGGESNCIKELSLKIETKMKNKLEYVHITYKHSEQYQEGLDAIVNGLKKNKIGYSIDQYDILYKDDIQEYEKEIGMSYRVIMFVITEYLQSIDCMYEMTQLFKNGNINDRIFPVVDLKDVPRNGDGLTKVKKYWENEKSRKAVQIATESGRSKFLLDEIRKIDDIINILDDLWDFIVHKNTGVYHDLIANDAEMLMNEIKKSRVPVVDTSDFTPSCDTAPSVVKRVVNQGDKAVYIENNNGTISIG